MSEPILETSYWAKRLADAKAIDQLHRAVFVCDERRWRCIEDKHREILAKLIQPANSVFDAGCGYGRLLTLMPNNWVGYYHGVDLSPDFIAKAQRDHSFRRFEVADLRDLYSIHTKYLVDEMCRFRKYNWAVLISIRPMVKRNLGDEMWTIMEREIRRVAEKLLYLEYDNLDNGSME